MISFRSAAAYVTKTALGQTRKSVTATRMSAFGGRADLFCHKADIEKTPDLRAYSTDNASLWIGGLKPFNA